MFFITSPLPFVIEVVLRKDADGNAHLRKWKLINLATDQIEIESEQFPNGIEMNHAGYAPFEHYAFSNYKSFIFCIVPRRIANKHKENAQSFFDRYRLYCIHESNDLQISEYHSNSEWSTAVIEITRTGSNPHHRKYIRLIGITESKAIHIAEICSTVNAYENIKVTMRAVSLNEMTSNETIMNVPKQIPSITEDHMLAYSNKSLPNLVDNETMNWAKGLRIHEFLHETDPKNILSTLRTKCWSPRFALNLLVLSPLINSSLRQVLCTTIDLPDDLINELMNYVYPLYSYNCVCPNLTSDTVTFPSATGQRLQIGSFEVQLRDEPNPFAVNPFFHFMDKAHGLMKLDFWHLRVRKDDAIDLPNGLDVRELSIPKEVVPVIDIHDGSYHCLADANNIKLYLLSYYPRFSQWKIRELQLGISMSGISGDSIFNNLLPVQILITSSEFLQCPYQLPSITSTSIPSPTIFIKTAQNDRFETVRIVT